MIDRIFSALLTFCLLAGGTVAIGSALFNDSTTTTVVTLPAVTITGQREAASGPVAQNETQAEPTARRLQ
ncbi:MULTISPECIES: hypothetical protein [Burkholderiales]|uniref:hypothetical protein n=1 Tax=Burkholderiales TaxID=80840 RepID=UPI001ADF9FD7|nr:MULTISPECIES: hypothetical protein [Burkholderiales]MBK7531769.1 hypothetical protein [Piscinibacter sp.]QTN24849.1 hypothetical protein HZ992_07680 [Rhizobacter sp. AJA081-3]